MADLGALRGGAVTAVPQVVPPPAAPPAAAAPEAAVPANAEGAAGRLKSRSQSEGAKFDSLDPQVVARRLAHLRPPVARPDAVPRMLRPVPAANTAPASVTPAQPAAAPTPSPIASNRRESFARVEPSTGASAVRSPADPPAARPAFQRVAPPPAGPAREIPTATAAPNAAEAVGGGDASRDDINRDLEQFLRTWSAGDELFTANPPKPQRRGTMMAVAGLLIVSLAVGAVMTLQWVSPREPAHAATPPANEVPGVATPSASVATPKAVAATAAAGAAPVAATQPPAVQSTAAVPAAPAVVQPATVAPATVAPPATIASVEPARPVLAAPPRAAAPTAPYVAAPPSWFTEDDPSFEVANHSAGLAASNRRLLVASDVDLRMGPDIGQVSLGLIKAGTTVAVGECRLWCAVTVNGVNGWVQASALADPAAAATAR